MSMIMSCAAAQAAEPATKIPMLASILLAWLRLLLLRILIVLSLPAELKSV
jgi:hypothetical protein